MEYATSEERDARMQDVVSILTSVSKEQFNPFDIFRAHYESAGYAIGADILIPKKPVSSPGPRPILVRIHGGFLITGSSLFPGWFSKWILNYAEAHSAIIISPNYRLLPEVTGLDILKDMESFWTWYHAGGPDSHLNEVGRADVSLDRKRLLLLGESAGGYLAIQSVLSNYIRPTAMITLYPMLDTKADHYTKEYPKPIGDVPNFPMEVIDDALATMAKRQPITEADPPARLNVAVASVQTGRFLDFLGSSDPELFVVDRLRDGNYAKPPPGESIFPPLLILHGEQDSVVPADGTRKFLQVLQDVDESFSHRVAFRPGEHGFDGVATLEDDWLRDGLDWISSMWLNSNKDRSR